jgi:hypothetical protein
MHRLAIARRGTTNTTHVGRIAHVLVIDVVVGHRRAANCLKLLLEPGVGRVVLELAGVGHEGVRLGRVDGHRERVRERVCEVGGDNVSVVRRRERGGTYIQSWRADDDVGSHPICNSPHFESVDRGASFTANEPVRQSDLSTPDSLQL